MRFCLVLVLLFPVQLAEAQTITPGLQVSEPAQVDPEYKLTFPKDFGSHPTFETEWWYYTGHLATEGKNPFTSGSEYGFQLTFFRRRTAEGSQLFLAHAALTDLRQQRFIHEQRFAPEGSGLAGSIEGNLRVWQRSWSAERVGDQQILAFDLDEDGKKVELRLVASTTIGPIAHGVGGYSRKDSCDRCASHYYSFPALTVSGQIIKGGISLPVTGVAWMDHEFMSNALPKNRSGWDWFSLMLPKGRSLMLFEIRDLAGAVVFRSGTVIDPSRTRALATEDFQIEKIRHWKSPTSGGDYPVQWRITIPSEGQEISVKAKLEDQEITGLDEQGISYWEGSASLQTKSGESGLAYVEMTGYDRPIGGRM